MKYSISFLSIFCILVCGTMANCQAGGETNQDTRIVGAYIHMERCFDPKAPIEKKEQQIAESLALLKESGLRSIFPYATMTSGSACYDSNIIPSRRYSDWDPLAVFVREARKLDLKVYPVPCVLPSGKHGPPQGILKEYPEWADRDKDGNPTGFISPGHPEAQKYIVSWLKELVINYQPDGLMLDYLRYPEYKDVIPDPATMKKFEKLCPPEAEITEETRVKMYNQFKRDTLTELAKLISHELRAIKPDISLSIYTWGPHVVENHDVAQDWRVWAKEGYIDMINVSGYCYPDNYGEKYMQVFEDRLKGTRDMLKKANPKTHLVLCLGVVTSHGKVHSAEDINQYLVTAKHLGIDDVLFFTWPTLIEHLEDFNRKGYLKTFLEQ